MISREEVESQTELSILIADNKTLEEENQGLREEITILKRHKAELLYKVNGSVRDITEAEKLNEVIAKQEVFINQLGENNKVLNSEKENVMNSLISVTIKLDEEKHHSNNLIEEVKRLNDLIKSSPQIYTENMEGEKRIEGLIKDLKTAHEELLRCDMEYGKLQCKFNQYEKVIDAIRTIADIRY